MAITLASQMTAAEPFVMPGDRDLPVPQDTVESASPRSFPDAAGLLQRAQTVQERMATVDLGTWRKGYFAGGDPGKFLPLHAMARLLRDPADADARRYLNDERSPKELYHFAAVNWARLEPFFAAAITPENLAIWRQGIAGYGGYVSAVGTENHKTMQLTSGLVFALREAARDPAARVGGLPAAEAAAKLKAWLIGYVRDLYAHGQGEWDSSTYLMFDINGFLNLYDAAPDQEVRAWARAGLEFLVGAYALKYRDGIYTGPNQRGHAGAPMQSIADQTGWIWWGSSALPKDQANWRFSFHAQTSAWRPGRVMSNLATKRIAGLPLEGRASKPNYYFGQAIAPVASVYHESLWIGAGASLGCLWNGAGGQMTRWQLVLTTPDGPVAITGGSPVGHGDADGKVQRDKLYDGNGSHDRTAATGRTLVSMTRLPDDEAVDYAFVHAPTALDPRLGEDGWWTMRGGRTWVALRGLAHPGEAAGIAVPKAKEAVPVIRFPGRRTGFVLHLVDQDEAPDRAALTALLAKHLPQADTAAGTVRVATRDRGELALAFDGVDNRPTVTVAGVDAGFGAWAVYDHPCFRLRDRVLTVSDGREAFSVDVRGDLPAWTAATP